MSKRALHIPPEILDRSDLSLLACAILAEVLDLYQVNGQVFASDEHFAERCHSKPRTVRETIAELVAGGHLTREVNYAARHKRLLTPNKQWQISPEVVADSATTKPEAVADFAGSSGEIRRDLWQISPEVVADSANINTILNTKGNTTQNDAHFSAEAEESASKEFKSDSPDTQPVGQPASAPAPDAGPAFEEFWQAYGKKEDTKKCKLRWKALSPAQRQAALAAVPAYVASKPDRQYRKNPLTWLNGECWQDEVPSPPVAGGHPATSPPIGAPLSLTAEVNEEFEAQQRARQQAAAAERARQFRATYAKP